MKTQPKPNPRKKPNKSSRTTAKSVGLVFGSGSTLRHFRLVEHKHTGKLIHHRHTSHLVLTTILAILGLFLVATSNSVWSVPQIKSGDVSVGAIVPGPPPTNGATILTPADNSIFIDQDIIAVSGSCESDSYVIVYSDGVIAGSTMCTSVGIFDLDIQLDTGQHSLTAKNFDNLNQPGPDTNTVTVTMSQSAQPTPVLPAPPVTVPNLPINPSIIPGIANPVGIDVGCKKYNGDVPTNRLPRIAVVCITRLLDPGVDYTLGMLVWGGQSPYALDIEYGEGIENKLVSVSRAGYKTVTFRYETAGVHTIRFKLTDSNGDMSYFETAVRVNGEEAVIPVGSTNTLLGVSWFETPVPLYLLAVSITLGFWAGDIFDRRFGTTKPIKRHPRAV